MKLPLEPIDGDDPGFIALLLNEDLPTEDLSGRSKQFFCLRDERGGLVAAGGLELCGVNAIMRSCVVAPDQKGLGIGSRLIEVIIDTARGKQLEHIFLLTESASEFFRKIGFRETDRDSVPPEIAGSAQFSEICPQSAVAMKLRLDGLPG